METNLTLVERLREVKNKTVDVELIPLVHISRISIVLYPHFTTSSNSKFKQSKSRGELVVLQNPVNNQLFYRFKVYIKGQYSRTVKCCFQTSDVNIVNSIWPIPTYSATVTKRIKGVSDNPSDKIASAIMSQTLTLFDVNNVDGEIQVTYTGDKGVVYLNEKSSYYSSYTEISLEEYNKISKIQKKDYYYLDPDSIDTMLIP